MPDSRVIETTRPATVVTPLIKIGGTTIPATFQIETIVVNHELNRISWAKIIIIDGNASEEQFSASNQDLFIPGKTIEIFCGYQSDNYLLFKGVIIKHSLKIRSGGSQLIVECRDQAVAMTLIRHSRYYPENSTDSDIITQMIGSYQGLEAEVENTPVQHKELVQYEATDWDFMVARAEASGLLVQTAGGKITVKKPQLNQEPVVALRFGATILELDAELDARTQYAAVKSRTWNPADQRILDADATDPDIVLNGNLTTDELAAIFGIAHYPLNHGGRLIQPEIKAWADAVKVKQELARVRGRVRMKGIHTLQPGMLLELNGLSNRFNGNAFVSGVHHHIAAGDWQLDVQFGVAPEWFMQKENINTYPAAALLPAVQGLQIGLVTQLENDPDGECRILVRLPIINPDEQGIWARMATLDAGSERGSFFLPEIGDEVVIGFLNNDPRHPVVLGMLHSSAHVAPLSASDSNPQKGLVTRSKLKMIFNDEKKSYTLETPAGKKLILDEDAGIIQLEDEHGNKLTMNSSGITIESLNEISIKATKDLQLEGMNVQAKASAALKAQGMASAEVSSSGTAILKGAIVQIN